MTDEELGRKWCAANGKRPWVFGSVDGLRWSWAVRVSDPEDRHLPWPLFAAIADGNEVSNSESAAYAAVGAALRAVWAFADESVRACDPLPAGCARLACEACDGLGYVDRKDGEQ